MADPTNPEHVAYLEEICADGEARAQWVVLADQPGESYVLIQALTDRKSEELMGLA
jgi:hypothetical protein